MSRKTVEVELYCYYVGDNALLVGETLSEPEEDEDKIWLPFSQISSKSEPAADGSRTYVVPEWWAMKNGLI
ncbi:hypothetical protein EHM76_04335 [bacterium]|nr:MAG: hypothetical protein EHM76_04335 [bacterium]